MNVPLHSPIEEDPRAPALLPPHATFTSAAVRWVRHWNNQLFSFAIERPTSFRFRSGEFVMIGLPGTDGRPIMRAYSIASPSWSDELEFLSIKIPDGPLTSRLQGLRPGDELYLGRKPTGTLVNDALIDGRRLWLLSTGTGLAPFLSLSRDPETYERFTQIILVHGVRQVADLAWRDELTSQWASDPLIREQALIQFHYMPTVTRDSFHTQGRITDLISEGRLFAHPVIGTPAFEPSNDRVMICGSTSMIKDVTTLLEAAGLTEGSNTRPGHFVIERAFVG